MGRKLKSAAKRCNRYFKEDFAEIFTDRQDENLEVNVMVLGLNEEEMEIFETWVDTESEGWPIREGCPPEIREWIERLLALFDKS